MTIAATVGETRSAVYELEIEIDAPPQKVWEAVTSETNAWWLPDFHMAGPESVVTFDIRPGGHLIEHHPDGGGLLWCTTQYCLPKDYTVYLFGHCAPEWGGPNTCTLKLQVEARGNGSVFKVQEAHFGNVDDGQLESRESGWKWLFTDGLKAFVEKGVRQDG